MRVLVLGSGVIGTTSAWYLRQAGFEVTVIDRQPGPALETSFANAGQLSFGYTSPWAAPGVPKKAIGWLFEKHAPLAIKPGMDLAQYRWLWQMLRNCTHERYAINKARMVRMSEYSRDCLNELRAQIGIEFEGRDLGTTQLFRTQQQLDASAQDIEILAQYGVPYEVLDRAGIIQAEPALAHVDGLVGALRLPRDQTGDCQLFTTKLAEMAVKLGVEFRFGQDIQRLTHRWQGSSGHQLAGRGACEKESVGLPLRPLMKLYPAIGPTWCRRQSGQIKALELAAHNHGRFLRILAGAKEGHAVGRLDINRQLFLQDVLELYDAVKPRDLEKEGGERRITFARSTWAAHGEDAPISCCRTGSAIPGASPRSNGIKVYNALWARCMEGDFETRGTTMPPRVEGRQ